MRGMHGRVFRDKSPELVFLKRNEKFKDEKVCCEDDRFAIQFDGVLLDRKRPQSARERFTLLEELFAEQGEKTAAQLRGAFNLAVFDKERRRVYLSNDLLGKRALYYCAFEDELLYAESYYDLLALLADEGRENELDCDAIRAMVEEGELTGDLCYLREIRYLDAYESLMIELEPWKIEVVRNEPERPCTADTLDDALEAFDRLFSAAVERQFAKNAEYGYRQFVTLSGGMDSRACLLQGIRSGYSRDIVCFNYSQSGSVDQRVAQQIAADFSLDYLYYPMDAAVFLTRLSQSMDRNECQQSGFGATGACTMATLLNTAEAGILHTGLCGGELMGDMIELEEGGLRGKLKEIARRFGFKGRGALCTHERSYLDNLRACHNSSSMFIASCEVASPFLDEDVVAFVTRLDPDWLFWRAFYRKWMLRYLPNDYTTTFFYGPIGISPARELAKKGFAYLGKALTGVNRREMNPVDYWMQKHDALREQCEKEYADGCAELRSRGVGEEVLSILEKGWTPDWYQRFNVLTAIRAIRDLENNRVRFCAVVPE